MSEPRRTGPEPLGGLRLAAGAWRAMQANARPLLVLGIAEILISLVAERAAVALKLTTPALTPEFLAYTAVGGALSALISGLTVRILLQPQGPRWRVDPGVIAYVLATLSLGMAMNVLMAAYMGMVPANLDSTVDPGPVAGRMFVMLILLVLGMWAWLRLMLWPVGLLVGDRSVTPTRSFQLMSRAVLGVIGAGIVLGAGPLFVYFVLASQALSQPWAIFLAAPFLAFATLAWAAIQAEAYRQRMAGGPGGVASAFD